MTGRNLLHEMGCERVMIGDADVYDWASDVIYLKLETWNGTDPHSRLCALHELAHWQQHRERPWLFWFLWLLPVRWWLEMDAWRRAVTALKDCA